MDIKLIISTIIAIIVICVFIIWFIKQPNETRIANVKQFLRYAVIEAEKVLGGGTGQLKLRYAYELTIKSFPWIASFITFEKFSEWVDEALDWANKQLESNDSVKAYVESAKEE